MNKCNASFDGMFAGFMCCRKPHVGGRHMWFWKDEETGKLTNTWYWTDATNSWRTKYVPKTKKGKMNG